MLSNARSRGLLVTVLTSLAAVVVALLVGAIFILLSQQNPLTAYRALLDGAFGSRRALGETLAASTPYIFGGLSFAIAYRAGLFNIGIEGQMLMGGLAAGLFAAWNFDLPKVIYLPAALFVAAIAGGIWGAIAGALKAISGAHEVITTIMLNYLAYQILSYSLLRADHWLPVNPQLQSTNPASPDSRLPNILSGSRLHAGLLVGLLASVAIWYLLFRTSFGYTLRTVGLSKGAAAYAGMRWGLTITVAMFISGALGGLGGASETLGLLGQQYNAPQGYGFASIAVGLVGRNNPFGVVLAALLFGILRSGSTAMQNQAGTSKELVLVLQGLVILSFAALAGSGRVQAWWAKRRGVRFDDGTDTIGVQPGVATEL